MVAIIATHPIQYQVPLWQMLAEKRIPFEVWYLSQHAVVKSRDREFGKDFAWDLDMLEGYPHQFLKSPAGATPNTPLRLRASESLTELFRKTDTRALWVQGWQVAAYWQAVWAAKRAGLNVWLRGESNNLAPEPPQPKRVIKRLLLGQLFRRVDHFLCIGTANRDLYRSYGVPESKLHMTPYAVDNDRFTKQAEAIRGQRSEIRSQWRIPEDAFCVLFCGKFIPKKRPMDLVKAAQLLITDNSTTNNRARHVHLLFVGSGELGAEMREACNVVFDAESLSPTINHEPITYNEKPRASFAGFLNQTEISKAYVAADVLVLPSDYNETWGLVVNEAMASRLRCIISNRCGCAPDLGEANGNLTFQGDNVHDLHACLIESRRNVERRPLTPELPSLEQTVELVKCLYFEQDLR